MTTADYDGHPAPWAIWYPEDAGTIDQIERYSKAIAEKNGPGGRAGSTAA